MPMSSQCQSKRRERERIVLRWMQLFDNLESLQADIADAGVRGVLSKEESRRAVVALDAAWHMAYSERPRLMGARGGQTVNDRAKRIRAVLRLARMKFKQASRRALGGAIWGFSVAAWCLAGVAYSAWTLVYTLAAAVVAGIVAGVCLLFSGE